MIKVLKVFALLIIGFAIYDILFGVDHQLDIIAKYYWFTFSYWITVFNFRKEIFYNE